MTLIDVDGRKYVNFGEKYIDFYSMQELTNTDGSNISILLGDVDKDENITIMDSTMIQKWLAKAISDSEINLSAADTDKDRVVTIMDATRIQKYLAKIITEL